MTTSGRRLMALAVPTLLGSVAMAQIVPHRERRSPGRRTAQSQVGTDQGRMGLEAIARTQRHAGFEELKPNASLVDLAPGGPGWALVRT